ncbi:MAG: spore germination protein [Clostridia bacterium]|nr:spore germination protein [Clostridia bacterium]
MRFFSWLEKAISFDSEYKDFELLEQEAGTPPKSAKIKNSTSKADLNYDNAVISNNLEANIRQLEDIFCSAKNKDIIIRRFVLCKKKAAAALFINGMADNDIINDFILKPTMQMQQVKLPLFGSCIKTVIEQILPVDELSIENQISKLVQAILSGQTVILIDSERDAIVAETRGYESRTVTESKNEKTVLGPKEAFVENLRTNITLIRKIIKTNDLILQSIDECKSENNARMVIVYRETVVNNDLLNEVIKKLSKIDTNRLFDLGTVEQLIEKPRLVPIPRFMITEKPDKVASHIINGGIAVLLEGSPEALIVPVTLFSLMASSEDTYLKASLGTLIRIIRYIGVVLSILLPGSFLAMAFYHQGVLSTEVLITVISSRTLVHSSIAVELLFLLIVFQLIREAGMRVPESIGQAIGIIGGLILGQAAVAANIVSTTSLIIVALSGLGNFCVPNHQLMLSVTYMRVLVLCSAWIAGFLGISIAILLGAAYISSLKSFGVPFLSPFAPTTMRDRPIIFRGQIRNNSRTQDYTNAKGDRNV